MKLIIPNQQYQKSYNDYIRELGDEERYPFPLDFDHRDFPALLEKNNNFAQGKNIPEHMVPSTTLWLVDSNELVGVTNLRHYLNQQIAHCGGHIGLGIRPSYRGKGLGHLLMKLSIEQLFARGVGTIHIHCYKNNSASARTILSNNGILDSEITEGGQIIQRYLVQTI
ncbi:GNAT family N-acetyltransferase [Colwellia asteriadis]|uniref:GNAT family N-acetyltransferase n=1 Tax=Colwellia asteriadis TaxID=517723 RepID=A0ABP3WGL1_9GAMM